MDVILQEANRSAVGESCGVAHDDRRLPKALYWPISMLFSKSKGKNWTKVSGHFRRIVEGMKGGGAKARAPSGRQNEDFRKWVLGELFRRRENNGIESTLINLVLTPSIIYLGVFEF